MPAGASRVIAHRTEDPGAPKARTGVLPADALDERIAIVGTAGSGKTYAAKGFVERLLEAGARVAVVDPLGVWWGLRANADGGRSRRAERRPRRAGAATPALSARLRALLARAAGSSCAPGVSGALRRRGSWTLRLWPFGSDPARSARTSGQRPSFSRSRTRSPSPMPDPAILIDVFDLTPAEAILPPSCGADRALARRRRSEDAVSRRCAPISRASSPKPGPLDSAISFASSRSFPTRRGPPADRPSLIHLNEA